MTEVVTLYETAPELLDVILRTPSEASAITAANDALLGAQSGLPTYDDLCERSDARRQSYVVMRPALRISDWSQVSGNLYSTALSKTFRDLVRDVIGVTVTGLSPLTRVETAEACASTDNTYCFLVDEEFSHAPFVWNRSYWRTSSPSANEGWWGQFTRLYVNLGGLDPINYPVVVELGFYISQVGDVQPTLGEDLLLGYGSMESGSPVPDEWTFSSDGSWASSIASDDYQDGSVSAKISATAAASGSGAYSYSVSTIPGRRYRLAGSYKTSDEIGGSFAISARLGIAGGDFIQADGRSHGPGYGAGVLKKAPGEWRRFFFDFLAPTDSVTVTLAAESEYGSVTGSVLFDKVTLRPVMRLDTFEPRVGDGDIPASETGSPSIFFSGKSVGSGSFSMINADGAYDYALGQLTWIGRKIEHWVGGVIPGLGAVDRDEWDRRFTGIVQTIEFTDEKVSFDLEDFRTKFHSIIPPNQISSTDLNVEENARGKPKPMLFGAKIGIKPPRVGYDSIYGHYGSYLVADTTDWAPGIYSVDNVYAYIDEDAANQVDTARRIALRLPSIEHEPDAITYGIASTTSPSSYQTTYTKNATTSWTDNMIASRILLHGDGYVEWSAGGVTDSKQMVGIAGAHNGKLSNTDIDYCWYLDGAGVAQAYELNVDKGSTKAYTGTYRFRVRRTGSVVTFEYNAAGDGVTWVVHYTSVTPSTAALCMKASINNASKSIYAVSLFGFGEITVDLMSGTFEVHEDVGPYEITLDNQTINYNAGTDKTATVPVGLYTANGLAKELTKQIHNSGLTATQMWYYDSSNQFKFGIDTGSGSITIKIQTGGNKEVSTWGLLGYDRTADKSGTFEYLADNPVFDVESIDTKTIIRCDAKGYVDDASGSYTGSAGALLRTGTDITRALVRNWLKQPASAIDEPSFVAARSSAAESLAIYLSEAVSSVAVFDRIESSNLANIVVGGDGVVRYIVYNYSGETVPLLRQIAARDHIEQPVWSRQGEEVFGGVTILYDQNPVTGIWKAETSKDEDEASSYDAIGIKEIETYIRLRDAAAILAPRVRVLAQRPPTRVKVVTNAKIFRAKVGDVVSITRPRALTASGQASNSPFRILSIAPDALAGKVTAELVEARSLPAGANCISNCQTTCEAEVQNECAHSTQSGCSISCQSVCQINCQVCGQASMCQTSCEIACQSACETACQICGQAQGTCQTGCQVSCQSTCELGAQSCGVGCEVTCQVCGQGANCQTACQLSCQTGCEVTCQGCSQNNPCQVGCETACQGCSQSANCQVCGEVSSGTNCQECGQSANCQTTCQSAGCQEACQFGCQGACQSDCQSGHEQPV